MTRDELIEAYAERIVDSMDMKELVAIAYDTFIDRLESYSTAELENEIADFYPDLLEAYNG